VIPLGEVLTLEPVSALWLLALAGWGVVASRLWRGLPARSRGASMSAHVLTLGGIMARSSLLGYGLLDAVVVATAGWWALLVVTRARPERLLDPERGASPLLLAWSAVTAAGAVVIHHSLS
jgi:hypothetical protein